MSKKVEFIVTNVNGKNSFATLEEAQEWLKDKLPNVGDDFFIDEIVTETIKHTIPSTRKRVMDMDVLKRIIDTFIEKANINNIKIDNNFIQAREKKYRNYSMDELSVYLLAEKYNYPAEKVKDLFDNKDGIMSGRFVSDNGYDPEEQGSDLKMYISWLAPFFILQDKYNIDLNDVNLKNYNYGDSYRTKKVGKKYISEEDPTTLAAKYPEATKIAKEDRLINHWNENIETLTNYDALEEYKKRIKEYPLEQIVVTYNSGDFKPCHNYLISFPEQFDPKGNEYYKTLNPVSRIPSIMFRNDDIYLTFSNYIGRHVHLRSSVRCDVDEKLYQYCIKNLK